jgi:DNA polymerase I-like protein with 3'-5' exonuclease and polymerase domains
MVRTPAKLAKLVNLLEHDDAPLVAQYIEQGNIDQINSLVKSRFKGEPELNLGSPVQMRNLLYKTLDLPVRLVNSTTATEREKKPLLARLVSDHKKRWAGHDVPPLPVHMFSDYQPPVNVEEVTKELLMTKAKTDDTAVDFAMAMDVGGKPEVAKVLNTIRTMKKCATRSSLFYKPYAHMPHWLDGKIHGQAGQCRTVTRRFAPSDPNLAQLPKKGEGVRFRECFIPHKKGAVIVSVDFAGQELRQGAGQSMDRGMLDCFVGDNKKDMHSMTAAGAMETKWGLGVVADMFLRFGQIDDTQYDLFLNLRRSEDKAIHKMADDLRKNAKNVNFGAQYDAQAPKLAETLIIPVPDAQAFLDAKYKAFPRFETWKDEVKADAERLGYVLTPLGGRRHLRDSLLSQEWGVKDKALRQGPNFKIQGASAEQTKLAMGELWRSGILFRLDMQFFAPIHDELVWSVAAEDALESIKVVVAAMTKPYGNLPVPFLGSVSLGLNFGAQIECGDNAAEDPALLDEIVPRILGELFAKTEVPV